MTMEESIRGFAGQFAFDPVVEHVDRLKRFDRFIVSGMGGSHLAADLVRAWNPSLDLVIHEDYGLPALKPDHLQNALFIASSHSGDTEEVLDGFDTALKKHLPVAVISTGGALLARAKKEETPHIQVPDGGLQPRAALGFSTKALLKLMGEREALKEISCLADTLVPAAEEERGRQLAMRISGKAPLIYASRRNQAVAYNWKIKCNETGKTPAFTNVFPELNHNEMTGFDVGKSARSLAAQFAVIILKDNEDDPRIIRRMTILAELYRDRGIMVEEIPLKGEGRFNRIFALLILADWFALHTARNYGVNPNEVPMVEEFKNKMKEI